MRLLFCVVLLGCETVQVRPAPPAAEREVPAQVEEDTLAAISLAAISLAAISLGVGPRSSCAVLEDESLWCWGDGDDGLLGGDSGPGPVRVLQAAGLSRVEVGERRVCFAADEPRCFGDLGHRRNPVRTEPSAVVGLESVRDFAIATHHACFIDGEGRARCLGFGPRAGSNARGDRLSDTLVSGAEGIAAGNVHSCALASGRVQCWGEAYGGRLGGANVRSFSESAHPVPDLAGVRSISAYGRGSQTCALLAGDEIRCWGQTTYGLVGETPLALPPVGEPIAKVVAGLVQVFAIAESGAVYRYLDQAREPAQVEGAPRSPYAPARRLDLPPVVDIGVGLAHTCALTRDGAVLCWGLGAGGRLGNGGSESLSTPTRVYFGDNEDSER